MKKFFAIFCISFLTCTLFTSCGKASWNQERAGELYEKPFEELTAADFDEMLELIDAGWEKIKTDFSEPGSTQNMTDEDREFSKLFYKLGSRARSMAHASKRVVSDAQVKAYETMSERINKEMKDL